MLNSLSQALFGPRKERREFARKKMVFEFAWLRGDERVPGLGTEISIGNCLVATREMPPPDFDAILVLGGRTIRVRLHTARGGPFTHEGARWYGLGCSFVGIAADEWDALVRILKNLPELPNVAQAELAAKDRTDDAYRGLPLAVQQQILEILSKHGRIAIPPEGQAPLLRLADRGAAVGGFGRRLSVTSRLVEDHEPHDFESVIAIGPDGSVRLER